VETTLELLVTNLAVHVEAQCDANDWDYATQHWVFCMDCYSAHISKEFLAWCTLNYPRMHLLYIPANFTGWLQPLDISFNGFFKHLLRMLAGAWLAQYVMEQMEQEPDPTKVSVNVKLGFLNPFFTRWLAAAFKEISQRSAVIKRGWDESGMGAALDAVKHCKTDDDFTTLEENADYIAAVELGDEGMTSGKGYLLARRGHAPHRRL